MVNAGTRAFFGKIEMTGSRIAAGAVSLKLVHLIVDLMIRRRLLARSDLEHMVARLSMEAHRLGPGHEAQVCEAGVEQVRAWLLAAGDELPKDLPALRIVKPETPED